jgi:hypothetical protein
MNLITILCEKSHHNPNQKIENSQVIRAFVTVINCTRLMGTVRFFSNFDYVNGPVYNPKSSTANMAICLKLPPAVFQSVSEGHTKDFQRKTQKTQRGAAVVIITNSYRILEREINFLLVCASCVVQNIT